MPLHPPCSETDCCCHLAAYELEYMPFRWRGGHPLWLCGLLCRTGALSTAFFDLFPWWIACSTSRGERETRQAAVLARSVEETHHVVVLRAADGIDTGNSR